MSANNGSAVARVLRQGDVRHVGEVSLPLPTSPDVLESPSIENHDARAAGIDNPNDVGEEDRTASDGDPTYRMSLESAAARETSIQAVEEEARQRGYKAGLEQAQEEAEEIAKTLTDLVASMRESDRALRADLSEAVGEMCLEVLTRIAGALACEAVGVRGMVETAIGDCVSMVDVKHLRVSEADAALLKSEFPDLVENWKANGIELVADQRVRLGGCIVEREIGSIDGRLETQLARIGDALIRAREQRAVTEA